jgi:hypothetical protein
MTDTQRRAIAAGFLHALQASPDVYQEWSGIAKDDYGAIGALVQKTMGLSQAPNRDDITAMAQYVDSHLQEHVANIKAEHDDAPHHVGFMAMMQQNS